MKNTLQISKFIVVSHLLSVTKAQRFNLLFISSYFFSKKTVELINSKKGKISVELIASWTVQVGDMDQCLHLWRYTGGFEKIDQAKDELWHDTVSEWIINYYPNKLYNVFFYSGLFGFNEGTWYIFTKQAFTIFTSV